MIGIDVSSWQGNIKPSKLGIDFCISKATESTYYVNPYCDEVIKDCIEHDILFGFYHYAQCGNAKKEAQYFWNHVLGYNKHGIPVLDYEEWGNPINHVKWCEAFIKEYRSLSGVYPMLYISASHCFNFKNSWIPKKCGLWVAGYPQEYSDWPNIADCPYDLDPWPTAEIWQFASDWNLNGYNGRLDVNTSFLDKKLWKKFSTRSDAHQDLIKPADVKPQTPKPCEELANEVIAGKWGTGWNRKQALDAAYGKGTYDHVQMIVDEKLGLDGC